MKDGSSEQRSEVQSTSSDVDRDEWEYDFDDARLRESAMEAERQNELIFCTGFELVQMRAI